MRKRLVAGIVLCCATLVASCDERAETKRLETPRGTIQYKETTSGARGGIGDSLRELTSEQRAKIQTDLDHVEPFIRKYVPVEKRSADLLENLDLAFAAWLRSSDRNKEPAQHIIDLVGAALGNYSIERLDVRWMVAIDEKGTEVALVGDDPPTRAYPFASIRYRIDDSKVDFVGALFEALKHQREKH